MKPVPQIDIWAAPGILVADVYYNPAAHGQETLELIAQVVEKAAIDQAYDQLKAYPCQCCRFDVNFDIGTFTIRGAVVVREEFEKLRIHDYLMAEETFQADVLLQMSQTPFCCCDNGCAIF